MATRPSSQTIGSTPQTTEPPPLLSTRWRSAIAGLFFSLPVVDFLCFPEMTSGHTKDWLYVAGSLPWLLSGYVFFDAIFAMVRSRWPAITTIRKILIGWSFGWFPLLIVFGRFAFLIELPYGVDLFITIAGTILWLASCYVIYDMLFTMAEARWPAAKSIREVIRSFFKMLLSSHGHHAP